MFISQILTKLKSLVYSKSETDSLLNGKASSSHTHTKSEISDFPTKEIDTIEEQGDGYIRYSNGLQICWGTIMGHQLEPFNDHYGKLISYPKSFLANTKPVINISQWRSTGDLTQNVNIYTVAESYAGIETDKQWGVYYTVFGMWK